MRSAAEQEIRDAVVAKLRGALPSARIIHELNVYGTGSNRIDVAAVTSDQIYAVEIKSARDKLDRLAGQAKAFSRAAHHFIVVAHEKFFEHFEYNDGRPGFRWPHDHYRNLWCYPEPEKGDKSVGYGLYRWQMPPPMLTAPAPRDVMHMLWADELTELAVKLRIGIGRRDTIETKIDQIAYHATGKEIIEGVCNALRRREFSEADPAVAG